MSEPKTVEERIIALVKRFAAQGPQTPRLVLRPEGVYVTEGGKTELVSWEEWEANQDGGE